MERITEQKLRNKRFRLTEEKIILALIPMRETLSTSRLIKIADISRSTLYRHHKNIHEIVPDYQKYIMKRYRRFIQRLSRLEYLELKKIYIQIFIFLYQYQKIIYFLYQYDKIDLTENMIRTLKPRIIHLCNLANEEIFEIYIKEISYIFGVWQRNGFNKNEINVALSKIMYLTETAAKRLSPLAGLKGSLRES